MLSLEQILSAVRWGMTTGGAYIVAQGYASDATIQAVGGALLAIVPFVWSMFVHKPSKEV